MDFPHQQRRRDDQRRQQQRAAAAQPPDQRRKHLLFPRAARGRVLRALHRLRLDGQLDRQLIAALVAPCVLARHAENARICPRLAVCRKRQPRLRRFAGRNRAHQHALPLAQAGQRQRRQHVAQLAAPHVHQRQRQRRRIARHHAGRRLHRAMLQPDLLRHRQRIRLRPAHVLAQRRPCQRQVQRVRLHRRVRLHAQRIRRRRALARHERPEAQLIAPRVQDLAARVGNGQQNIAHFGVGIGIDQRGGQRTVLAHAQIGAHAFKRGPHRRAARFAVPHAQHDRKAGRHRRAVRIFAGHAHRGGVIAVDAPAEQARAQPHGVKPVLIGQHVDFRALAPQRRNRFVVHGERRRDSADRRITAQRQADGHRLAVARRLVAARPRQIVHARDGGVFVQRKTALGQRRRAQRQHGQKNQQQSEAFFHNRSSPQNMVLFLQFQSVGRLEATRKQARFRRLGNIPRHQKPAKRLASPLRDARGIPLAPSGSCAAA